MLHFGTSVRKPKLVSAKTQTKILSQLIMQSAEGFPPAKIKVFLSSPGDIQIIPDIDNMYSETVIKSITLFGQKVRI